MYYPWCTESFYTCTHITIEVAVFVRLLQFLRLKSHKDFPGSLKAPFSQVIKCYYNYYNPINECSSFNSSTLTVQVVVSFWPADLLHGWTNLNNNKKNPKTNKTTCDLETTETPAVTNEEAFLQPNVFTLLVDCT